MLTSSVACQNNDPAASAIAVTPSDTTDLGGAGKYPRGLYVGGAGDVTVVMSEGSQTAVVFSAVPAGTILPIRPKYVKAATTATNIVAMY